MQPTVYLDATIPSFYFEDRPGTILQAWREITVAFWDFARGRYDLFISDETLRELEEFGYLSAKREQCLESGCWASLSGTNPGSHRSGGLLCQRGSHAIE